MGKYETYRYNTDDKYYEPTTFDEYVSTAENPGIGLLLFTIIFCLACLAVAFVRPIKKKEDADEKVKTDYIAIDRTLNTITVRTRKGLRGKKNYGGNPTIISELHANATKRITANQKVRLTKGLGSQQKEIGYMEEDAGDSGGRLEVEDLLPNWHQLTIGNTSKSDDTSIESGQPIPKRQKFRFKFKNINRKLRSLGCVICSFDHSYIFAPRTRIGSKVSPSVLSTTSIEMNKTPSTLDTTQYTNVTPPLERVSSKNNVDRPPTPMTNPSLDDSSLSESDGSLAESEIASEMEEIFNLAAPWTIVDLIGYCADFFIILIVSHFMGTAVMICYSTVGFILGCFNMFCSGIYGSCYKHVNNAVADGSNHLAGQYIQISMALYTIISAPCSLIAVIYMPKIMIFYGYADGVVDMCQSYAAVAAFQYVVLGSLGMIGSMLDIDGHAKFNAVWGLWECIVSVVCTVIVITVFRPSLLGLGIFHLVEGFIMNALYIYIAYTRKGWLDPYIDGMLSGSAKKNNLAIMSVIKRSIPVMLDEATYSLEWFVLSIFAAHQGAAEAVVWILFSYIWAIIELIPESYAEAATSRVAFNLSAGNIDIARMIAGQSIFLATSTSIAMSVPILVYRHFIVWCISADEGLDSMLIELLPYIAFCQPFITLGMTAASINEGLCLYHRVVKRMFAATCLVTIPVAAILTYIFHLNVEGLIAAVCMGYVVAGVLNFNLFMNADWEKAMRKNQEVTEYETKTQDSVHSI